ncbi:hypothetical protein VTN49DRAFT_6007 [Thermomyces lanuginosus]|uniref:uncharacterized protein n=1 Tax=Thermomyces lanuginosus TaxID=5541 RepID=UPI00374362E8
MSIEIMAVWKAMFCNSREVKVLDTCLVNNTNQDDSSYMPIHSSSPGSRAVVFIVYYVSQQMNSRYREEAVKWRGELAYRVFKSKPVAVGRQVWG